MTIKIGINGFGRMGRLSLRAAWHWDNFEIVQVNEAAGDAPSAAHLLKYDSVHGTWDAEISAAEDGSSTIQIGDHSVSYSQNKNIQDTDWSAVDMVIECTGKFKSQELLAPYFD